MHKYFPRIIGMFLTILSLIWLSSITVFAYSDDELCNMALQYYVNKTGYTPGHVDIGTNGVIHLYDVVTNHTATCDWYYVDRNTGIGTNMLNEPIDLSPYAPVQTPAPSEPVTAPSEDNIPPKVTDPPENDMRPIQITSSTDDVEINWGWDLFDQDALEYSNDLAISASVLNQMAESSQDDVESCLGMIGLENISSQNYSADWSWEECRLGITFASCKTSFDGIEKNIITMIIKDLPDYCNLMADIATQIDGVSHAKDIVVDELTDYLSKTADFYGCDLNRDNTILFASGYGFGGAIAGMLSDSLQEYASSENTFIYTFGTINYIPEDDKGESYGNIHNIINTGDLVSILPIGYTHYGENWYIDKANSGDNTNVSLENHSISTYLECLLNTAPSNTIPDTDNIYALSSIQGAVDIQILDNKETLLGEIKSQTITPSEDCQAFILTDSDKNYIYAPMESTYRLSIKGTGDSIMSFTQQTVDVCSGEILEEKTFSNVKLANGKELSANITAEAPVSEVQLFVLDNDNTKIAEVFEDGTEELLVQETTASETPAQSRPIGTIIAIVLVIVAAMLFIIGIIALRQARIDSQKSKLGKIMIIVSIITLVFALILVRILREDSPGEQQIPEQSVQVPAEEDASEETTSEPSLEDYLADGEKYLKEKDYQQAETAFEEAIKLDSKCIKAYQGLVEVYRGAEDNEHLEKVYKDAVAMINDECMANGKISEDWEKFYSTTIEYFEQQNDKEYVLTLITDLQKLTSNEDVISALNQKKENYRRSERYEAYYQLILEYQEKYGECELIEDGYESYLKGLCFAKLLDFNQDGDEELIIAYFDPARAEAFYDHELEIWDYLDGELRQVYSDRTMIGSQICSNVGIANFDGRYAILAGRTGMPKRIFVWEYTSSQFEQTQAVIADNNAQSTINGATASLAEAMTVADNILNQTTLYHLVYLEEDNKQALTELQNTISTLQDFLDTTTQP